MRLWFVALIALALLPALSATAVPPAPRLPETTLFVDTEDDYSLNGALDLQAAFISERYSYDPVPRTGHEVVLLRLQVRDMKDLTAFTPAALTEEGQKIEYLVHYKAGGKESLVNATVIYSCRNGPNGLVCQNNITSPNHLEGNNITLVLDAQGAGLTPGVVIDQTYAASGLTTQGTTTWHDVAPTDNQNLPQGQEVAPTETGSPYTIRTTYPFLSLQSVSALERPALPGGIASYTAVFHTLDAVTNDHVYVDFQAPSGWKVEATLGLDFTVSRGGQDVAYEFGVRPPVTAKEGERATVRLDASLFSSLGHVSLEVTTVVTGPKVTLPEFGFALKTPGPFEAGQESRLRFEITKDGTPLERFRVQADFLEGTTRAGTVGATYVSNGTYEVPFVFPKGGSWTVDVYVSELEPAPHQLFGIQVKKESSKVPAFEFVATLLGLGLAGVCRLRR